MITHHGEGRRARPGETVLVHYTGSLTNGTVFDSSLERKEPIAFPLGKGAVIKGWDEGIARLGIGDQAVLIIPPEIGYGAKGAGKVIPPNATLIFIVELMDIKGVALSSVLLQTFQERGIEAVIAQYRGFKAKGLGDLYSSESDTNGLGYKLMGLGKLKEAIAIFELNVEAYPNSGNAYDSLAEAEMKAGNTAAAIQHYERALQLDPKNGNASKMLEKLRAL
jgi:tetratricopeptide (TPR) repeat protein